MSAAFFMLFDGRVYFLLVAPVSGAANDSQDVGSHWEMWSVPTAAGIAIGRPGWDTISSPL